MYKNKNNKPVYVPEGPDNMLYGLCTFSGHPPKLFMPGTGHVEIRFDGLLLVWLLRSNENTGKETELALATFLCNRCNSGGSTVTMRQTAASVEENKTTAMAVQEKVVEQAYLFPNPVTNKAYVQLGKQPVADNEIVVMDAAGRNTMVKVIRRGNTLELDVSSLAGGVYFIRMKEGDNKRTLKFVKL